MRRSSLLLCTLAFAGCASASAPDSTRIVEPAMPSTQAAGVAPVEQPVEPVPAAAEAPETRAPRALGVPTPAPAPAAATFVTVGFCPHVEMDIHRPAAAGPVPVVVFIHGGAWQAGTRTEGFLVDELRPALVAEGFAVAAIDYRLAPQHPWPAQTSDVRCAVRFLRTRGQELGVDGQRIGLWGESAGGHLAALLATAPAEGDAGSVRAVLDVAGPADLGTDDWPEASTDFIRSVFGSEPDTLRDASPVSHVTQDDPPFLLVHGDRDDVVPPSQTVMLERRLRLARVPVRTLVVRGGGHDLRGGGPLDAVVRTAVSFFASLV